MSFSKLQFDSPFWNNTSSRYQEWIKERDLKPYGIVSSDKRRWTKIVFLVEIEERKTKNTQEQEIEFCFDQKNGNIFLDYDKDEVKTKMFLATVSRPIVLLVKAFFQDCIFGTAFQLTIGLYKKEKGIDLKKRIIRNLINQFRTPIYFLALTVLSLFGFLVSPFSRDLLYDIRDLSGRIEHDLMFGKKLWLCPFHTLTPCFQPYRNVRQMAFKQIGISCYDSFLKEMQEAIRQLQNRKYDYTLIKPIIHDSSLT